MIKKHKETVSHEHEVVDCVVCDVCGKEFTDIMDTQEFLYIRFTGGFQGAFADMGEYEADICSNCVKTLLGQYIREVNVEE